MNAKILMRLVSSKALAQLSSRFSFKIACFFSENDQNTRMKSYQPIRFHQKFIENQSRSCNDRHDFRKVACPSGSRPSPGRTTGGLQSKIVQKILMIRHESGGIFGIFNILKALCVSFGSRPTDRVAFGR